MEDVFRFFLAGTLTHYGGLPNWGRIEAACGKQARQYLPRSLLTAFPVTGLGLPKASGVAKHLFQALEPYEDVEGFQLFIDSGVYQLQRRYTKGKATREDFERLHDTYLEFIREVAPALRDRIYGFAEVDASLLFPDWLEKRYREEAMKVGEEVGVRCIPVWHQTAESFSTLYKHYAKYPVVAIGTDLPKAGGKGSYDATFVWQATVTPLEVRGVKTHLFGVSYRGVLLNTVASSADSSIFTSVMYKIPTLSGQLIQTLQKAHANPKLLNAPERVLKAFLSLSDDGSALTKINFYWFITEHSCGRVWNRQLWFKLYEKYRWDEWDIWDKVGGLEGVHLLGRLAHLLMGREEGARDGWGYIRRVGLRKR